jgi:hypothetical protein
MFRFCKFDRMKTRFTLILLVVTTTLIYQSCDYVSNAVPIPTAGSSSTIGSTTGSQTIYRKALIEDYTGHKCGNCPGAARELHRLDSVYAGRIVPIAVHAGFYANVNSTYPADLRSQAGTDWDQAFQISMGPGNPNGLVGRVGYNTSNFIQAYSLWGGSAVAIDTMPAAFKIDINNAYNTLTSVLTTTITSTALKDTSGTLSLVVVITEDSIIGAQLDYSLNTTQYPNQIMPNYVFNHVLRGAVNSSWGAQILNGTISRNSVVTKNYSFTLNSGWNYKHCKVVAFIFNSNPSSPAYYEVLQAEDKAIQ